MNDVLTAVAPDLLAMALCLFLLRLLRENRAMPTFKAALFCRTVIFTLIVLSAETASVLLDAWGSAMLDPLDEALYTFIYLAAPLTILTTALLFDETMRRFERGTLLGMAAYAAFILSNVVTHQLFTVTGDTVYARGPLYPVYLVACLGAGFVFLWANVQAARAYEGYRQWLFFGVFALVLAATSIEALAATVLVIWPALTIALFLYYVYLRELQFAYDPLTGVLNRVAFAEGMRTAEKAHGIGLAMLDLNVLKTVNDTIGHSQGDKCLVASARMIADAFEGIGSCYRIGGDEFCVICQGASATDIEARISRLNSAVQEHEREIDHPFSIASGYALRNDAAENLYATLARADRGMYRDKERWRSYYRMPR